MITLLDNIVETYQGMFGLIKVEELECHTDEDIEDCLQADLFFIASNRDKIAKKIPAIDNLLQEMECLYLKTQYKLKNLR